MGYADEYRAIAEHNGFLYEDYRNEIKVLGCDNGNKVRTKYVAMQKDNIIYYAYDMFSPDAHMGSTYAGFYTIIDSAPSDLTCKTFRRINPIMDFILMGKVTKIDNKFIDKHLAFKTNDIETIKSFITEEVVKKYIKLKTIIPTTTIIFGKGDDIFPRVTQYKDKMVVGIQTSNTTWVEPEKIIDAFNACSEIIKTMPGASKA